MSGELLQKYQCIWRGGFGLGRDTYDSRPKGVGPGFADHPLSGAISATLRMWHSSIRASRKSPKSARSNHRIQRRSAACSDLPLFARALFFAVARRLGALVVCCLRHALKSLLGPQLRSFLEYELGARGLGGRLVPTTSPWQLKEVIQVAHKNVGSVASLGALVSGEVLR